MLAEYNQNNVMQRRYVYGPGIDNPVMVEEAGGTKNYLHRDGKGSIIAATSGNSGSIGNVTAKFTSDAWGFGADEATSPYRFTARRVDEETGNYYYRNRYYHPDSGRFMSQDPIGYGDGLNMYAYAYNDPVNFRDPMGLSADDDDHEPKVEGTPGTPPSPGNRGNTQGGSGEQPCPECKVTAPRISGITIEHLLMEQFFSRLKQDFNNIFAAGYFLKGGGNGKSATSKNKCNVLNVGSFSTKNGVSPLKNLLNSEVKNEAFATSIFRAMVRADNAASKSSGNLFRLSVSDTRNFLGFGNPFKVSNPPIMIADSRGIDHIDDSNFGHGSFGFFSGDLRAHVFAATNDGTAFEGASLGTHVRNFNNNVTSDLASGVPRQRL